MLRLSKSKLIAFRQCPKRLWLEVHRPDLRVYDDSAKSRFESGYRIGELAQAQYPDGVLIAPDNNLTVALQQTIERLVESPRKPLFEATFEANGILVRADLLVPIKHGWHMVEVKSSASVKDYHVEDAAIQHWVTRQAGLSLAHTSLLVVDSKWTFPGGSDYSGLLRIESVDEQIAPLQTEVPKWLASAKAVAAGKEPTQKMGRHCDDPFVCAFQTYCTSSTPRVQFPIAWLPSLRHTKRTRYESEGIHDLSQVPMEELTPRQKRVVNSTLNSQVFIEPLTKAEQMSLGGTRFYLDFETIGFTVPIWPGTRPYQQIPFQWSCHVEQPNGAISHAMFLDLSGGDPSREFIKALIGTLGKRGPIVVYNQVFEIGIMRALADRFPEYAGDVERIIDRVVDLLPLVNDHYYHPDMKGSWSIKAVLPTIAPELDYASLGEVTEGIAAQSAYLEAIHPDTPSERKAALESSLEKYCTRDTYAMVKILHYLCD